jgi:hypothetical protein
MFANELSFLLTFSGLLNEMPDNPNLMTLIGKLPEIIKEFFNKLIN